jgi:hypothetical protein
MELSVGVHLLAALRKYTAIHNKELCTVIEILSELKHLKRCMNTHVKANITLM